MLEVIVLLFAEDEHLAIHALLFGRSTTGYSEGPVMTEGKPYKTRTGKVLTDADIEAMADEAERGYDVEMLLKRRRGRGRPMIGDAPSEGVPVRLDLAMACRDATDLGVRDEVVSRLGLAGGGGPRSFSSGWQTFDSVALSPESSGSGRSAWLR